MSNSPPDVTVAIDRPTDTTSTPASESRHKGESSPAALVVGCIHCLDAVVHMNAAISDMNKLQVLCDATSAACEQKKLELSRADETLSDLKRDNDALLLEMQRITSSSEAIQTTNAMLRTQIHELKLAMTSFVEGALHIVKASDSDDEFIQNRERAD